MLCPYIDHTHVYIYVALRSRTFKELAPGVAGTGNSDLCRAGQKLCRQELMSQFCLEAVLPETWETPVLSQSRQ